jgi:hypothetical protein
MRALAALAALALTGCGYHLVHAPADPAGPFAVVGGRAYTPDAAAMAAAEEGARAELARAGELASGASAAGVIEVEILRVDEVADGITLAPGRPDLPLARGVRVTAVGRARMRRAGAVVRDTGDVRAGETVAAAGGAARGVAVGDEATRAAARRLGEILVRRLLGFPEPGAP